MQSLTLTSARRLVPARLARSLTSSCANGSEILFPSESHGNDYATNWALASCGVSVGSKAAFRNAESKTAAAFAAKSAFDKRSKVFLRQTEETQVLTGMQFDKKTFEEISGAARAAVGEGEGAAFVVDAGLSGGSAPSINVRAVSDDAAMSQLLKNILCGVPKKPAQRFVANVQVIHSAVKDEVAGATYCAVMGKVVAARGAVQASALKKAIAVAAAEAAKDAGCVVVAGKAIQGKDGKVTLVAGGKETKGGAVVIDEYVMWTPSGLTRVFNAGSSPADAASPNSVVEGGVAISPNGYTLANYLPHPSTVVVGAKPSAEGASQMSTISLLGGAVELENKAFDSLVALSKAQVVTN